MGQAKYNPTAIAAKNGELPPKPERISKREAERQLHAHIIKYFMSNGGLLSGRKQESKHTTIPE